MNWGRQFFVNSSGITIKTQAEVILPCSYTTYYSTSLACVRGNNQLIPNIWIIETSSGLALTGFTLQTSIQQNQALNNYCPYITIGY